MLLFFFGKARNMFLILSNFLIFVFINQILKMNYQFSILKRLIDRKCYQSKETFPSKNRIKLDDR